MADYPLEEGIGKFAGDFLTSLVGGLQKKKEENALHELYTNSINRLNSLINPPPKVQPINRFGGTVETEQKPDYKKGLQFLYETLPRFAEYGDKGATYGNLLSGYYKSSQPEKKEPVLREVNGQIIDFQDINDPKVLYGKPKEEKKKTTTGQYLNMTTDELLNLPVDELENVFLTLPNEKQTELITKMPYLQQKKDLFYKEGDFAPKTRGGFRRGSFKETLGESKDMSKFSTLDNYYNRSQAGEQFTEDEKEKYKVLKSELANEYDMNDIQLQNAIERLNNTTTDKERVDILNSLKQDDYHEPTTVSQEQVDYDRGRVQEWIDYLDEIATTEGYGEQWNIQKANFWKEMDEYYSRGSLTKKEYNDLRKSYY